MKDGSFFDEGKLGIDEGRLLLRRRTAPSSMKESWASETDGSFSGEGRLLLR
jgi:hypothetical protein